MRLTVLLDIVQESISLLLEGSHKTYSYHVCGCLDAGYDGSGSRLVDHFWGISILVVAVNEGQHSKVQRVANDTPEVWYKYSGSMHDMSMCNLMGVSRLPLSSPPPSKWSQSRPIR